MIRRGGTKHCCWGKCNSDSRYPERLPEGTYFIRFPKPGKITETMTDWEKEQARLKTEKAKRWQYLCGRSDFQTIEKITKDTYICSIHFVGGKGPTSDNDEPILATLTPEESLKRQQRKRKPPTPRGGADEMSKTKKQRKRLLAEENQESIGALEVEVEENIDEYKGESNVIVGEHESAVNTSSESTCSANEKSTQTVYDQYILGAKIETMILRNSTIAQTTKNYEIPNATNRMDPSIVLKDRQNTKFFIGLFPEHFESLFAFLGPAKYKLKYWDSKGKEDDGKSNGEKPGPSRRFNPKEELFITLLRLRRGFSVKTIAFMFDTTQSLISTIFITWIQFMFLHFKSMKFPMFPSKDVLKSSLPKVFKGFKNVRCSVDCTEFFCETPRDYAQQGNTYSSYKHHTTMKALIAVTPKGAACFVSDLYEGNASDVDIFGSCGILQHIEPGDVLLVDKGFTIQDLLLSRQATIKIPAFLGKRDKLTAEEEMRTRRVAKARIHVERFNERLKKFRLLSRTIPLKLSPIASQMVYVGCCLVNFQSSLCI